MNKINLLNFLVSLFDRWLECNRINPMFKVGFRLIAIGISLICGSGITKFYFNDFIVNKISRTVFIELSSEPSQLLLFLGLGFIFIGLGFCLWGIKSINQNMNKKCFYYLIGLPNQSNNFPLEALPKIARWFPPKKVPLSINTENIVEMKKKLLFHLEIISNRIEQPEKDEIYFGGLARVPYLFFIGYGFRNAHSSITLLDHSHKTTKWFTLEDIDTIGLDLKPIDRSVKPNMNGDIGVAIEFTCKIPKNDFPESLKEHVIRIKLNNDVTHNQIKSRIALERIVDSISQLLIRLNKNSKTIHLFISAQSTFTFSLGRRYQDGMMGEIQVYNYDAKKKKYVWAFKLDGDEIKLVENC
ncbi:MAG: SAVED domain-containing protein [Calditrichaeota bacterium]|nr:MAG: SAVED domain-containing protein [Calditrichota bacterium]